jgi:ankyrin repeat protein
VRLLLDRGTDVTAGDNKGNTALHYAASNGHLDVVKTLVEDGGSDIEAKDKNGNSPLLVSISLISISAVFRSIFTFNQR